MKTKKIEKSFPPRMLDRVIPWHKEFKELRTLIELHRKAIYDRIVRTFEANNGCERCRGRGWVVTWDTLDSMSGCYAEYGECPNKECTLETRSKSGLHPNYNKYDGLRGTRHALEEDPAFGFLVRPLAHRMVQLEEMIKDIEKRSIPRRDDVVVIVKGRKAPVGFVGKIFWMGESNYGIRVGIKHAIGMGHDEKVQWTYLNNIDMVDLEACAERGIDWKTL